MDIEKAKYEIWITSDEMYKLGCVLIHYLENLIKDHYNELQQEKDGQPIFYEQEKGSLSMMKFFFEAVGRVNMYESSINDFNRMFAEKRDDRAKKGRK